MTFTDFFFTWPVLVLGIVAVCAARIAHDHLIERPRKARVRELDAKEPG
jgi:hypothetical protein